MQSQDSISRDRTTPSVAEPRPGTPERTRLRISATAPSEQAVAALEGRRPIADPSERPRAEPKPPAKGPAPGRPGRATLFARKMLKTAATLLILALAVLAALVIWDASDALSIRDALHTVWATSSVQFET